MLLEVLKYILTINRISIFSHITFCDNNIIFFSSLVRMTCPSMIYERGIIFKYLEILVYSTFFCASKLILTKSELFRENNIS